MPDVLIRGLSVEAVERIDEDADAAGLSRNEYLRRHFDVEASPRGRVQMSDFVRFAEACRDLADPEIMAQAWR